MTTPLARYREFHGRPKAPYRMVDFHPPKTLIYLGQAVEIVYLSDKKNGGGDGKPCEFIHKFESPVSLYMDETGKHQLYLLGKRLFVNSDGIQN